VRFRPLLIELEEMARASFTGVDDMAEAKQQLSELNDLWPIPVIAVALVALYLLFLAFG
jgi:hypothetical protein